MKGMLKELIYKIFFKIILILDFIVPKNPKQFLFASNTRKYFSGNAKKLFEDFKQFDDYIIAYTQTIKLEDKYYIDLKSINGIIYFLRTKYLIGTHGTGDFFYPFSKRKFFIQTWHGSPLKKMGLCDANRSIESIKLLKKQTSKIDYLLSSSEMVTSSLIRCFGIEEDKILNIGYPRNDQLINYKKKDTLAKKYNVKKIILYAPTFRDWTTIKLFPFEDMSFKRLEDILEKNDAIILIRSHINEKNEEIIKRKRVIEFGFDKCSDVNDILGEVDILITDYSSIYFDFLLLDRPIIFIPYDLKEYKEKRGFLYDGYKTLMIGDTVLNGEQFLKSLESNLKDDKYKEDRKKINILFNESQTSQTYKKLIKKLDIQS